MPTLIVKNRAGAERKIDATAGRSLMENLRDAGFGEVLAICGGCCSCATCHVRVEPSVLEKLPPMSADESDMLDSTGTRDSMSRLSCQITVSEALEGGHITIAEES
jgi:ferredoxin, 2Fe-2S